MSIGHIGINAVSFSFEGSTGGSRGRIGIDGGDGSSGGGGCCNGCFLSSRCSINLNGVQFRQTHQG